MPGRRSGSGTSTGTRVRGPNSPQLQTRTFPSQPAVDRGHQHAAQPRLPRLPRVVKVQLTQRPATKPPCPAGTAPSAYPAGAVEEAKAKYRRCEVVTPA